MYGGENPMYGELNVDVHGENVSVVERLDAGMYVVERYVCSRENGRSEQERKADAYSCASRVSICEFGHV